MSVLHFSDHPFGPRITVCLAKASPDNPVKKFFTVNTAVVPKQAAFNPETTFPRLFEIDSHFLIDSFRFFILSFVLLGESWIALFSIPIATVRLVSVLASADGLIFIFASFSTFAFSSFIIRPQISLLSSRVIVSALFVIAFLSPDSAQEYVILAAFVSMLFRMKLLSDLSDFSVLRQPPPELNLQDEPSSTFILAVSNEKSAFDFFSGILNPESLIVLS